MCSLREKDLELEVRLVLIESKPSSSATQPADIPSSSSSATDQQFVSIINQIKFQK